MASLQQLKLSKVILKLSALYADHIGSMAQQ